RRSVLGALDVEDQDHLDFAELPALIREIVGESELSLTTRLVGGKPASRLGQAPTISVLLALKIVECVLEPRSKPPVEAMIASLWYWRCTSVRISFICALPASFRSVWCSSPTRMRKASPAINTRRSISWPISAMRRV